MFHHIVFRCAGYSYNVKARILLNSTTSYERVGRTAKSGNFAGIYGGNGVVVGAPSGLYLYKGDNCVFKCYNIYFFMAYVDVRVHDGVSMGGEIFFCHLLSPFAGDIMLRH